MRRGTGLVGVLVATFMIMTLTGTAVAQPIPTPPNRFYGDVTVWGNPAPDGTVVSAKSGGEIVASTTTESGHYVLDVPTKENPYTVEFYVSDTSTGQTHEVVKGKFTPLDLALTDNIAPTSSVDAISPYWRTSVPFTITATASDALSGVENVQLYYRYSSDNLGWGAWTSFGVDVASPWGWSFTAPLGNGYYEFYSIARDRAGNVEAAPVSADTRCDVDNVAPTSSVAVSDTLISEADVAGTFTVTVTFSEAMNPAFAPTITFSPAVSSTLSFTGGAWTVVNTVYTASYSIADANVELSGVDVTVGGGKDAAGNAQSPDPTTAADKFSIDTVKPTITSATASPDPAKAGSVTVTVVFSEAMKTAVDPTVTVTGLTTSYPVAKSTYTGTTWVGTFTLIDENEGKTATISVTGGQDPAGNVMIAAPAAGTFAVDTISPTITITVQDTLISDADIPGTFWVRATFSETMDNTLAPTIAFTPNVTLDTLTSVVGAWSADNLVYTWTYTLTDAGVENAGVDVTVSGAKDLAGNTQVPKTDENKFDMDTKNPTVTLPAYTPDPTTDSTPTYSGTATDATTNVVDIEYRVDNGAWTDVDAFTPALSVSFTFTTPALADGTHTIDVRARDAAGNWSAIVSDTLTVVTAAPPPPTNKNPIANAGPAKTAVVGDSVSFDGSASNDTDGIIVLYTWDFGDGSTGTGVTVSHTYTTAGTYTVTLTVRDNLGATGTATTIVTVKENQKPVADAGSSRTAFVGKNIDFDGSGSSDPDGTITKYEWSFGDGASGTGASSSHSYSAKGTYTVTLTVTDNKGATGTDSITVKVEELPVPAENEAEKEITGAQTNVVFDATSTMGVKVKLNTTGNVNVYLVEYSSNPHPEVPPPPNTLGRYIDISVSNPDSVVWPMYIEIHYTDAEVVGLDETKFALYYFSGSSWLVCSNTGVDTVNNVVWAWLTRAEVAGSPLAIGKMPAAAQFTLSNLSVSPAQVNVGGTVTVQVAVKNIGDLEGSTTVDLLVNGVKEQSKSVTLASGASTTVSFSVTKSTAGSYTVKVGDLTDSFTVVKPPTPAAFTFTGLVVSPVEVKPGDEVTVSVTVKNTGEQSGTYSAELKMDGVTKETKTGTLAGGASATVTFKVSSQAEGTHTLQLGDLTDSFKVTKPAPPTPPPDYTMWIVAAVVAVVVVAAAVWYMRRKK